MKDLRDSLYGKDWEVDEYGLVLPPGTKKDTVYEYRGDFPESLLFIRREQATPDHVSLMPMGRISGFEIRGQKVYRWIDGEKVEQQGLDAIRTRAMARSLFGEQVADMAGIEPE